MNLLTDIIYVMVCYFKYNEINNGCLYCIVDNYYTDKVKFWEV